ncbi:hypothetical protein GCM10020295_45260 [Streptomyces cinereospinus]
MAETVCGRCAAMEPTEGCTCWTCAWAFCWLMAPLFRARGETGASDRAGGTIAAPFPAGPSGGGEGSGTAGVIGRASQARLNEWLRRHDVWDSGGGSPAPMAGGVLAGGVLRRGRGGAVAGGGPRRRWDARCGTVRTAVPKMIGAAGTAGLAAGRGPT